MNRNLAYLFIIALGKLEDILTTHYLLGVGGIEDNPFMAFLMAECGLELTYLMALVVSISVWVLWDMVYASFDDCDKHVGEKGFIILSILQWYPFFWNMSIIFSI